MGCASSKILARSWSFKEEVKQRLKRRSNGVEELLNSKNGADQLFALLCTANAASTMIKAPASAEEPEKNSSVPVDHQEDNVNTSPELSDIEIINTWELLAGLDEEEEVEDESEHHKQQREKASSSIHDSEECKSEEDDKFIVSNDSTTAANFNSTLEKDEGEAMRTRNFRTVEEFDAMAKGDGNKQHDLDSESGLAHNSGSKRKAMARELAALKVPAFEFSKTGSLRDWLQRGGQVISPGSYVTPKFGNFVFPEPKCADDDRDDDDDDDRIVFDPNMIAQFEQAMNQLATVEESVLQQIIESSE